MLVLLKKMKTGCNVEKAYHKDMPKQIKAILQDYKISFSWSSHQGYRRYEWDTSSRLNWRMILHPFTGESRSLAHSSSRRRRNKFSICSSTATSDCRYSPMEHRCFLHRRRMVVFNFVSTTAGSIKRRSRIGILFLSLRSYSIV